MADISQVLRTLISRQPISSETMARVLQMMGLGGVSPSLMGAFFTAYEYKGYSQEELIGILEFLNYKFNQAEHIKEKLVHIYADTAYSEYALFLNIVLSAHGVPSVTSVDKSIGVNFYNYLGVNTSDDINKIHKSIAEQGIGVYATNYKYKLRNIYDVLNELQFSNIIDASIPFTCPFNSIKRVVIRQDTQHADTLANAVRAAGGAELYLVSRSDKSDFILPQSDSDMNVRSAKLRHLLSGRVEEDTEWVLPLITQLVGNPALMMPETLQNMRLNNRFDNLIEFTNKF